jgi:hypothetical protein
VPRGVQDDHRGRVHQAVDGARFQHGRHSALAVLADHGVGVPVGDVRGDPRHGEHDGRRGRADRSVRPAFTAGRRGSSVVSVGMRSGPGPDWLSSRVDMLLPPQGRGGAGQPAAARASRPRIKGRDRLLGGRAGAVEDACGGADVHVERDAVVGVPGHPGHVGRVELPGEQRRGAEHVPQAVPGPPTLTGAATPPGLQVGELEDAAVKV